MYDKIGIKKYSQSSKGRAAKQRVDRKRHRSRLTRRYGLIGDAYDQLLASQGNVCASCKRLETRLYKDRIRYMSVDHCHTTGKVRGLLCYGCNSALGFLDDKKEYVEKLLAYISKTQ